MTPSEEDRIRRAEERYTENRCEALEKENAILSNSVTELTNSKTELEEQYIVLQVEYNELEEENYKLSKMLEMAFGDLCSECNCPYWTNINWENYRAELEERVENEKK